MSNLSNFDINQGTDVVVQMTLENPDRSPKQLFNYTAKAYMKKSYLDDSTQATKFLAYPYDAANGILELRLTAAQTAALDHRLKYFYDVNLYHDDSVGDTKCQRVVEGVISVKPSVT